MPANLDRVIEQIDEKQLSFMPLFKRMDEDYTLYTLAPFLPNAGEGIADEDAYTSNNPQVVANKIIYSIVVASKTVRVENDEGEDRDIRNANDNAERLGLGMLRNIDRRLENSVKPGLLKQLAFYSVVRGGHLAVRALLRKDSDGNTYEDVRVLDPRSVVYEIDDYGNGWAAHISTRSRAQIQSEYPNHKFEDKEDKSGTHIKVIDYYYTEVEKPKKADKNDPDMPPADARIKYLNGVIIERKWAKKPRDTFAVSFPLILRAIGHNPGIQGAEASADTNTTAIPGIEDRFESVFSGLRGINKFKNRAMTYRIHLQALQAEGIYKVKSRDGEMELEDGADEKGANIGISTENEEDVELLQIQQLGKDADQALAVISAEEADAGLPDQWKGRMPAPVSANALRMLNDALVEKITPFIEPVASMQTAIIERLMGQFEEPRGDGMQPGYKPISVRGKTFDSVPFNRDIAPEHIEGHGEPVYELTPDLPSDDILKWQIAQMAGAPTGTGEPLMSPKGIRDNILKLQDSDLEESRIYRTMAKSSTPVMLLRTELAAALEAEDEGLVSFVVSEIKRELEKQQMEDMGRQQVFAQMVMNQGAAGAAQGIDGANGTGGGGGGPVQQAAQPGINPAAMGTNGQGNINVGGNPDGSGTAAPRGRDTGLVDPAGNAVIDGF